MPQEPPPLPPVETLPLIREVDAALHELLRGLGPEAWERPAVGCWSVKDVAAHLLDTGLRRLSLDRDRHRPPAPGRDLASWDELLAFLDELNATWTEAARRLSPAVIVELLEWVDPRVADYFASLDPDGEATFPVAWAGEETSRVWMDVAREFTEKWHHQQQIRAAVRIPGVDGPRYVAPMVATLVRAVPRAYAEVEADDGVLVRLSIPDLAGTSWLLTRASGTWRLALDDPGLSADAVLRLPADAAWRFLVKGIDAAAARAAAAIDGDARLVEPFFGARGVMA